MCTPTVCPIPSKLMTWTNTMGVVEASDLHANGIEVMENALQVRSDRTCKVKTFFRTENLVDGEGELHGWIYKTLDGKLEVHILND